MKIFSKLRQTLKDYQWATRLKLVWLPMVFAVAEGIMLDIIIFYSHGEHSRDISMTLPLFFGACFFFTSTVQFSRFRHSLIINIVGILAIAADCYLLHSQGEVLGIAAKIGHVAVYSSLALALFFVPTLRQKDDVSIIRFAGDTIVTATLLMLATVVATSAITGLVILFAQLFSIELHNLVEYLWAFTLTALFGSMLVLTMPMVGERGMATDFAEKIAVRMGKFVFLPILFLYLLLLYLYIGKIVITWQLPDGMVSYLTACLVAELLAVECLLHSKLNSETPSRFWSILRRILPLLVLPAVVLMSVGIARRVGDYGWTILRFYVLGINVWFYAVAILLFVSSIRRFKVLTVIVSSLCGLFMLVSVIPGANISTLTKYVMLHDVEQLIAKATPAFPDHALETEELQRWYDSLPADDAEKISSRMYYIADKFGVESVSRWVLIDGDGYCDIYGIQADLGNDESLVFDFDKNKLCCGMCDAAVDIPEGYTKVQSISGCDYVEKCDDGMVALDFRYMFGETPDTIRVVVDTKAEYGDCITIKAKNGVVIKLVELYLRIDHYCYCTCQGYVFSN